MEENQKYDAASDTDTISAVQKMFDEYSQLDRSAYVEQKSLLEKMIKLDNKNSEWYLLLYGVLRYERTTNSIEHTSLTKEEIHAIGKASDCDPNNPKVMVASCCAMAEFIKCNGIHWTGQVCFGLKKFFHTAEEIFKFVEAETSRALDIDPQSVLVNVSVSEMYSSALPTKLRDIPFAKRCLERAVQFNPNSSIANARLASFCCSIERDLDAAEKYYTSALQSNDGKLNFSALLDLLQAVHMSNNPSKFQEMIELEIQKPDWNDSRRSRLYYIQGLSCYLRGENSKGLQCWFDGYKHDSQIIKKMKYLDRDCVRYNWAETLQARNIFIVLGKLKVSGTYAKELLQILIEFRVALGTQHKAVTQPNSVSRRSYRYNTSQRTVSESESGWQDICTSFGVPAAFSSKNFTGSRRNDNLDKEG